MARHGITESFATYGATLRNPQWSVSAWAPDGALVVSLWNHHYRAGPGGAMEFADSMSRWSGPGNAEFRRNVAQAHAAKSPVRLVIASTDETAHVQSGKDASKVRKDFDARTELVGEVASLEGDDVVFRFRRA